MPRSVLRAVLAFPGYRSSRRGPVAKSSVLRHFDRDCGSVLPCTRPCEPAIIESNAAGGGGMAVLHSAPTYLFPVLICSVPVGGGVQGNPRAVQVVLRRGPQVVLSSA